MALKLPKTLGACVDLYLKLRAERLAQDKVAKDIKAQETEVSEHLIAQIDKRDEGGAVGKTHTAVVKTTDSYRVEDWDAFYAHIRKTGDFQYLNRAINQAAVQEFVDAQEKPAGKKGLNWKPKLPPGVGRFPITKLSVTKK
jgi:hypothetical protein